MRILVFYPYIPWPLNRGTFQRTYHLLHQLARHNEVDFFSLAENGEGMEHRERFEKFCRRVEFLPFSHPEWEKFPRRFLNPLPSNIAHWTLPQVAGPLGKFLGEKRYDLVHTVDIILAQYFFDQHAGVALSIDRSRVDLQYQLMEHKRLKFSAKQRLLRYEAYLKLWRYEKRVAGRAQLEVVCGEDDETFIRKYISQTAPVKVIPNGADLNFFHPAACPDVQRAKEPTILFCGAMDYNPNIDAMRWFFEAIHAPLKARIPTLRVLIVGKDPTAEVKSFARFPDVEVTGAVPDVRPYYRRAWLQIVPLRIGGGTRLKILESLGIGTPVVSTTIGAQGLGLKHRSDILLADTAEQFVEQTVQGLNSAALREQLEKAGLESVRARFSWESIGQQLHQTYLDRFAPLQQHRTPAGAEPAVLA
jgi:glycosyltransferase involved in cell wall biosynthesis